ncbi:hypothetical protein CHUAL_005144 [Chamberlinius hualienensis]
MANNRTNFLLKKFIPASATRDDKLLNVSKDTEAEGKEVSEFYELTCQQVSTKPIHKPQRTYTNKFGETSKSVSQTKDVFKLNINHYLKSAEMNDLDGLRSQLDHGMDVNIRDSYGWTALMCAACAGAKEAVIFLLNRGADRYLDDTHGMKAWKFAYKNKHLDIVNILRDKDNKNVEKDLVQAKREVEAEIEFNATRNFCDDCEIPVKSTEEQSHKSSTVHQFSKTKNRHQITWANYKIPPSNVGFQMMLKDGWNKEQGLGPEGSGTRCPPKTLLKRDREGLGSKFNRTKPKVTHFEAGDARAIQNKRVIFKAKKQDKRQKERQSVADRLKTIGLRREFSSFE